MQEDGERLVSQYSKGMKTRLGVARALLNNPDLIFMDEPTVGLDPGNARRIKDLIQEQKRNGRTVFLTTHDMTVADELCDRVAFIVNGQIQLIESPHDLKLAHGTRTVRVEYRSGPRNLDSGLSGISIVFQAAVPKPVVPKYTTSGVRRPSEL